MRRYVLRVLAVLLVTLSACGCGAATVPKSAAVEAPSESVYERDGAPQAVMPAATAAPALEMGASGSSSDAGLPSTEAQAVQQRKIVRNADIVVRVDDVPTAVGQARALAESAGGYVVSESSWDDGTSTNAVMTFRVPAERFDDVLQQVNGLADKVLRSSVTGQYVTEEYVDLESRLTALRATEEQLLLLLEDVRERMKTADDILAVYRELNRVQLEIEQLRGRQSYLDQMVAMSTINLTLYPQEAVVPVVAEGWQPVRTVREALNFLSSSLQGLVNVGIWLLLVVLPIAVVIALPFVALVLIIRAMARRRRRTGPQATSVPSEPSTSAGPSGTPPPAG